MKITLKNQRIFQGMSKANKPYYYISETNYKNAEDKLNFYVSFAKMIVEPTPHKAIAKSGNNYKFIDIEEADCSLGVYNGKPQITIFNYKIKEDSGVFEDTSKFGGESSKLGGEINIEQQDLPFY